MISNELQFIELLFHELVHLQFYIPNQADFNEAFATWFAEKATLQFIENSNRQEKVKEALIQAFHKQLKRNRLKLTNSMEAIEMAKTLYDSEEFKKMSNSQKESARAQLFEKIRQHFAVHEELKRWGEMEWNNALLISLSTYYRLVDSIEAYSIKHKLDAKALLDHVKNNPNSILSEL
jgi:predicted aminopeptidase